MIGLVAITIGFIVLGVFGAQFTEITVQTKEFSECYKYPEDQPPIKIECDVYLQEKNVLFVIVIVIISGGIIALLKGVRGKWTKTSNLKRCLVLVITMMMIQKTNLKENYLTIHL